MNSTPDKDGRIKKQFGLALEALEAIADGEGTAQVIAQQTLDEIARVGIEAIALEKLDRDAVTSEKDELLAEVRRLVDCAVKGDNADVVARAILASLRTPSPVADEALVGDTSWKPLDQCEDEAEIAMYWRLQAYSARRALQQAQPVVDGLERGWQPIETAPEEEGVLLCLPRYGIAPEHHPFPEMAVGQQVDGEWYSDSPYDKKPEYRLHNPTHWQPLPAPPAIRQLDVRTETEG